MKTAPISFVQKSIIALAWLSAIASVILISQSLPPQEQNTRFFFIKIISPIALALIITIYMLVLPPEVGNHPPSTGARSEALIPLPARSVFWRIKTTLCVITGMLWVTLVAPLFLLLLGAYEATILRTICRTSIPEGGKALASAVTSARFRPNYQFYWSRGYEPIQCQLGSESLTISLRETLGTWWEFLLNILSGMLLLLLTLGIWYYVTYRLLLLLMPRLRNHFASRLKSR